MSAGASATAAHALERGWAFLARQAQAGFPDARHEMRFPHAQGFTGADEQQGSDGFARAVIGSLLADIAEAAAAFEPGLAAAARRLAAREAEHVAGGRLQDRAGGWSYFPGLPELPPDLDSLAAASGLFARVAPQHLPACRGPIALALSLRRDDAVIGTWLVAPDDPPAARERMRRAIDLCWGDTVDVDVLARFWRALLRVDPAQAPAVAAAARWIAAAQRADGAWAGTWYAGTLHGSALCLDLLAASASEPAAVARAAACARHGLAEGSISPVDTALALWMLHRADLPPADGLEDAAVARLAAAQADDGGWPEEPWIEMAMGRARGRVTKILTWGSRSVASATVLRALALAAARGSPGPVAAA